MAHLVHDGIPNRRAQLRDFIGFLLPSDSPCMVFNSPLVELWVLMQSRSSHARSNVATARYLLLHPIQTTSFFQNGNCRPRVELQGRIRALSRKQKLVEGRQAPQLITLHQ